MTALRAAAVVCALAIGGGAVAAQGQATYLHALATFDGPLLYDGVRIAVDQERDETYLIYQNLVHVFSSSGMEIFRFGEDLDLGQIIDVAVDRSGDIFLLSLKDSRSIVTRCDFRGVPIGPVEFKGLPAGLEFSADRMVVRDGLFYFASLPTLSVIVTDAGGRFRSRAEFVTTEDLQSGAEAFGFTVDREGNMFFTMPTAFKVIKRSPDGTLTSFGSSGSAPGKFGIVAGIATDSRGYLFVADKLKCVVAVFDPDFKFVAEFGYRGEDAGNLIVPEHVAIDRRDRVYVSQWRRRGVSVFAFAHR